MNPFRNLSTRSKLIWISMISGGTGLLLAGTGFIINDLLTLRAALVRDLSVQAEIISTWIGTAVTYNDPEAAAETLETLRSEPHILAAAVFDANGELFATYRRDDELGRTITPRLAQPGVRFESGRLSITHNVQPDDELEATLFLLLDLEEFRSRLRRNIAIGAVVLLLSFVAAFVLASRLQQVVSRPLLELADVARTVSREKNYSVRAPVAATGKDEVGTLVRGFNDMLSQIQKRDAELERHRDHLEEEVDARTAELTQVNAELKRMARERSQFFAKASHELRTPLNAVIGFSELLQEKVFGDLNDKQEEYIQDILASGRHLLALINDLLELTRPDIRTRALELDTFDLPSVIESAMLMVRQRASGGGIELVYEVDPALGAFTADPRRVKQVVVNLLNNAVKFTKPGGAVSVSALPADGGVRVAVCDTGVGIRVADRERIFREFEQGADIDPELREEGTGLGLAVSKNIVELHGGGIWVESEVGKGSTFIFVLPDHSVVQSEQTLEPPIVSRSPDAGADD